MTPEEYGEAVTIVVGKLDAAGLNTQRRILDLIAAAVKRVVTEEREACAKLVLENAGESADVMARDIRERGK